MPNKVILYSFSSVQRKTDWKPNADKERKKIASLCAKGIRLPSRRESFTTEPVRVRERARWFPCLTCTSPLTHIRAAFSVNRERKELRTTDDIRFPSKSNQTSLPFLLHCCDSFPLTPWLYNLSKADVILCLFSVDLWLWHIVYSPTLLPAFKTTMCSTVYTLCRTSYLLEGAFYLWSRLARD